MRFAQVRAELWGPVETDSNSDWHVGAAKGTNNTGEITGIGQALMWLRDIDKSSTPAVMLFDSCYAANMVTGRWQPNANIALVEWARNLLKDVEATGRPVHWVHIKGHSSDGGNDRADELVQWGKSLGPFCRLREGGSEGNSLDGAAVMVAPRYDRAPGSEWTSRSGFGPPVNFTVLRFTLKGPDVIVTRFDTRAFTVAHTRGTMGPPLH